MKGKVLATLIVATAIVTCFPVSAVETDKGMNGTRNYVDADADGICDNCMRLGGQGQGRGNGLNFVDKNNDGICDNFVDENADGICDGCMGLGGQGKGNGLNFVDENNDGVCDNFASGARRCRGRGRR